MSWFSKKFVEVEMPDGSGGTTKTKIPQKQWDKWMAEGKIKDIGAVCRVHVLPPHGIIPIIETWVIGREIDADSYEQLKDANGELYVVHYRDKDAEPRARVVHKDFWEDLRKKLEAI